MSEARIDDVKSEGTLAAVTAALRGGTEEERLRAVGLLAPPPADAGGIALGLDLLIEAMGDESFLVRREAVRVALLWPDAVLTTERLVEALAEPDNVGRRNAALDGVARLGGRSIEPLLRALHDRPAHRKVLLDALSLLEGLGRAEEERVAPALSAALSDEDPNVRAAAAEGLGRLTIEAAVPPLLLALQEDDDLVVRLGALEGLNRHRVALPHALVRPLLDTSVLRPAALLALGQGRDPSGLPLLLEALLDRARGAREAALLGLARLHEGMGGHGHEREHLQGALLSLSELAVRSMIRALLEANPEARAAAALLLRFSGRRDVVRPLILALLDHSEEVARAAGDSLTHLGAAALQTICDLLPEMDAAGRHGLFLFFERHGSSLLKALRTEADQAALHRVAALLCDGLSGRSEDSARAAARALGVLGGREALPPLFLSLASEERSAPVREAFIEALLALGDRYPEDLRALLAARGLSGEPAVALRALA